MLPKPAYIARIVDYIESRRRRYRLEAIRYLIDQGLSLIPLLPRRHRRVLLYKPVEFQLDNYTDD
jgi:hypothetical protein